MQIKRKYTQRENIHREKTYKLGELIQKSYIYKVGISQNKKQMVNKTQSKEINIKKIHLQSDIYGEGMYICRRHKI